MARRGLSKRGVTTGVSLLIAVLVLAGCAGEGGDFHMANDGDYQAAETVTVNGDTIVTLIY